MENTVQPTPLVGNVTKDVKLGLVFGGLASLFILIGIVPVVGCLFSWLHWFVSLFGGFTVGAVHNARQEDLASAVKASLKPGMIAGAMVAVVGLVVNVVSLFVFSYGLYSYLGSGYTTGLVVGYVVGAVITFAFTVLAYVIGAVIAAFVNANGLSWMNNVTKMFR
jgi:hypothetical protein